MIKTFLALIGLAIIIYASIGIVVISVINASQQKPKISELTDRCEEVYERARQCISKDKRED